MIGATALVVLAASVTTASIAAADDAASLSASALLADEGTFHPLGPVRIMDTRSGLGGTSGKIPGGGVAHLTVTGNGVPTENVSAVVLNVTVTGPTLGSYLTVWPTGVTRPTASSLNFPAGFTGANSVTVGVGTGGQIDIFNNSGATHVIVDILGYYSGASTGDLGGQYIPVEPIRLADTRTDGFGRVPGGFYISVAADFGVDNPNVRAFAVNITAVSPTGSGYLTAWDGDPNTLPTASTLNFTANKVVPNFAVVPAIPCVDCGPAEGLPSIGVFTSRDTHILVDLVGFYDDATLPDGLRFLPNVPLRIADTRSGQGWPSRLGPGTTATIEVPGSLAGPDTWAVAMNVTAVQPTVNTYLTVWPAGFDRPTVSNLNPSAGAIVPNAVQTLINVDNEFSVFNFAGNVHVLADVVGTFYLPAAAPSLANARTSTPRISVRPVSGAPLVRQAK